MGDEMPMRKIVAKRMKMARIEREMTQAQLAERLGIGQQQVTDWESGTINLGVDTLERIAKALRKPPTYFLQPFDDTEQDDCPDELPEKGRVPKARNGRRVEQQAARRAA